MCEEYTTEFRNITRQFRNVDAVNHIDFNKESNGSAFGRFYTFAGA